MNWFMVWSRFRYVGQPDANATTALRYGWRVGDEVVKTVAANFLLKQGKQLTFEHEGLGGRKGEGNL